MSEYLLEMNNITKIFPGVKALNSVHFNLKQGEIHALMGENGAGNPFTIVGDPYRFTKENIDEWKDVY